MNGEKFNSARAPQAVGLYPHARKVGDLLFLSGVGPRKAGEKEEKQEEKAQTQRQKLMNFKLEAINILNNDPHHKQN